MVTTSSKTRRPFGKPARSPPSSPLLLGRVDELVAGGMAKFSLSMSAWTVPVKFWKPPMIPEGRPVIKMAVRSARFTVPLL